jgi:hypothetical protein
MGMVFLFSEIKHIILKISTREFWYQTRRNREHEGIFEVKKAVADHGFSRSSIGYK